MLDGVDLRVPSLHCLRAQIRHVGHVPTHPCEYSRKHGVCAAVDFIEPTKVLGGDDRDDQSKNCRALPNAQGASKCAEESAMAVDGVEEPAEEKTRRVDNGVVVRAFNDNCDD
jgi:hypothetical protein